MKSNDIKCIICGEDTIKYGVRNGRQRYRCKSCHKTFYDPATRRQKYQHNTDRVLSLLFNLLENNFYEQGSFDEAIQLTEKYHEYAINAQYNAKYIKEFKNRKELDIGCYKAKLLVCQDEKNIIFIPIPSYEPRENNQYKRTITIHDCQVNSTSYSFQKHNKPIIKRGETE